MTNGASRNLEAPELETRLSRVLSQPICTELAVFSGKTPQLKLCWLVHASRARLVILFYSFLHTIFSE